MDDELRPLEWLNTCTPLPPARKKKPPLSDLLQNFPLLAHHYRSPTRRPPFSYATLILLAVHHAPERKVSLSQIYNWIQSTFPYYENRETSQAWKNSIRHNLSLNKCFVRVPREQGRGKGGLWKLDANCEKKLLEGDGFYRLRKKRQKKVQKLEPIELEQVVEDSPELNIVLEGFGFEELELDIEQLMEAGGF